MLKHILFRLYSETFYLIRKAAENIHVCMNLRSCVMEGKEPDGSAHSSIRGGASWRLHH